MEFDVQKVDLDQLAQVAQSGGIAALEELAATGKVTTPPAEEADPKEAAATESAATDPDKPAAEEAPADAKPEDKEHGTAVANRSGTGTIPYSVLKGARERANQVESENALLRKQLDELTARVSSPQPAAETPKSTDEVDARIDAMQAQADSLKEDFPELAAVMAGQIELLKQTRQQLVEVKAQYEADRSEREQAAQADVQETMQEAIDGNPVLTAWQAKNGAEWNAAVDMDSMLRAKPEWAEKTFAERFQKVVELVRVMNPEFEVPAETKPEKQTDAPAPASTETKPQAPASNKPPVNSLSDIPGGVPPAAGKREQVEELSGAALGNRFMTMSPDQISEYLASLAM